MTLPHRRHKNTKGGSVIAGLRMDPALAEALTERAHANAAVDGALKGDIAATARTLLRAMLRVPVLRVAGQLQGKNTQIAGLRCEPALLQALNKAQANWGLSLAGTTRHLLRVALDIPAEESLEIEERFTIIAQTKYKLMKKNK